MNHSAPILGLVFVGNTLFTADANGLVLSWEPAPNGRLADPRVVADVAEPIVGLLWHHGLWGLLSQRLVCLESPKQAGPHDGGWATVDLPDAMSQLATVDDRLLVAGDTTAVLFEWGRGWEQRQTFQLPPGTTDDLDLAPDGKRFLVVKGERVLHVLSTKDGQRLGGFERKQLNQLAARFATEGDYVYRGCRGSYQVKRVRWMSGRGKVEMSAKSAWSVPVSMSGDRRRLTALIAGYSVQVFDLDRHMACYYAAPYVDISRERLMAGLAKAPVALKQLGLNVFKVSKWKSTRPSDVIYSALAVNASGNTLALGSVSGEIILFDTTTCSIESVSPKRRLIQPGLSRIVLETEVRGLGVSNGCVLILDPDGRFYELTAAAESATARGRLQTEHHRPDYWHQSGQLLPIPGGRLALIERDTLTLFDGVSGAALSQHEIQTTSAVCLDTKLWYQSSRGLVKLDLETFECTPLLLDVKDEGFEVWGGPIRVGSSRLLVSGRSKFDRCDNWFRIYDVSSGATFEVGPGLGVWPGDDNRHFAVNRRGSGWEVWDGERADLGPLLVWEKGQEDPLGALSMVTPAARSRRVFAKDDRWRRLVAWDFEGRILAHLAGHGAKIEGLLPSEDGTRLLSWDRAGIFRSWDLSRLPVPDVEPRILTRDQLEFRPPSLFPEHAKMPSPKELLARFEALTEDPVTLQHLAWTLPDEVPEPIDQYLTDKLGQWRPQIEVHGRKVNGWLAALESSDPHERNSAAHSIGECLREGVVAIDALIDRLEDDSEEVWVKGRAAQSLVRLATVAHRAAPALVSAYPQLSEFGQSHAVQALKRMGSNAAVAVGKLLSHRKVAIRQEALIILRSYGPGARVVVAAVGKASRDKRSPRVRSAAFHTLSAIGGPDVVPFLEDGLRHRNTEVIIAAARSVGRVGFVAASVAARLDSLLDANRPRVQRAAAAGLAGLGEAAKASLPKLERSLSERSDEDTCLEVPMALIRITGGHTHALNLLTGLLSHPKSHIRDNAVRCLCELGALARAAVPEIIAVLEHDRGNHQGSELIRGLAGVAAPSRGLAKMLMKIMLDPSEDTLWTAAARALGHLGGPDDAEPLVELARDDGRGEYTQLAAVKSALRLTPWNQAAVDTLIGLATRSKYHRTIAGEAASVLAEMNIKRAVPALEDALQRPDQQAWAAIDAALGMLRAAH